MNKSACRHVDLQGRDLGSSAIVCSGVQAECLAYDGSAMLKSLNETLTADDAASILGADS